MINNRYQCSSVNNLANFLVDRACQNPTLANYLYWYLTIECEDERSSKKDLKISKMYSNVLRMFLNCLYKGDLSGYVSVLVMMYICSCLHLYFTGTPEMKATHAQLKEQQHFVDRLVTLVKIVAKESGNRKRKTEKFQQFLAESSSSNVTKFNFNNFGPIVFPLDPSIQITGIAAEKVSLFKSALMPSK